MKYLFTLLLITFLHVSNAQYNNYLDTLPNFPIAKISVTPQQVIFDGLRFDIEKISGKRNYIGFSPEIYFGKNYSEQLNVISQDGYYTSLFGVGSGLNLKHIFNNTQFGYHYIMLRPSYNFFFIEYHDYGWQTQTVNGFEQISWELLKIEEQIHRIGANLSFGLETEVYSKVFFDMFAGVGLKYSLPFLNYEMTDFKYDDYMWSYGYTGMTIFLGVRFGLIYQKN